MSDDSAAASDIEPEEQRRQKHPENYDKSNKLNLGKFHRYGIAKPSHKPKVATTKKKIRDIERLLKKKEDSMPEEVKQAKLKELKELKKSS